MEKPYNLCLKEITNDGSKFWQTNSVCVPEEYVPKDLYTKEIKGNVKRRCPNISKIKKLGFKPKIDLNKGLEKTFEWYSKDIKGEL